ncbi:MAG: ATPase domain-containing protein [Minisyncoccota bacterium]
MPEKTETTSEKPAQLLTSEAGSVAGADALRPTGLPQLDFLLHGGLPANSTILIAGASGTGKTILAIEWLFSGYGQFKEPGLFISLTEPVSKAIKSANKLSFFKAEYLNPAQVHFTDSREILKDFDFANKDFDRSAIKSFVESLGTIARQSGAKRIVIDSVTAMAYRLKDRDLIRDFIFELGLLFGKLDANIILTGEIAGESGSIFGVEEFISDGIIKLYYERDAHREPLRKLDIVKMRGSSYEPFPTSYRITKDGVQFYPHLKREPNYEVSNERASTGVPGLDQMTYGGYFVGSSVLLTGASGTVGTRPSCCSSFFVVFSTLEIFPPIWTGMRIVRD